MISRRQFLSRAAGGVAGTMLVPSWVLAQEAPQSKPAPEEFKLRLGACDWSLEAGGPSGLEIAKTAGLDGLEVSVGGPADTLQIADPKLRQEYKDQMQKTGVVVPSVALALLNNHPLATEPRAPAWLERAIEAAKDLGGKVILVAFFGKGDLLAKKELKVSDVDAVVARLKEAAPKAHEAGVILGLENTLSAEQNMALLERVKNDAVRVYYDIGNSTYSGYDVPAEIQLLGDRICQFHFKDGNHYLGEGKVQMQPVAAAIRAINYRGWIVLETAIPSKDRDADFKKNAEYVRKLMAPA